MAAFDYQGHKIEYDFYAGDRLRHIVKSLLRKPNTILFLHGINDSYQNHVDLITILLNKGFDVYALDFPGHGNSERLPEISWDILVDIVQKFIVLKRLHHLVLYAYSMGASIALKLLEKNPQEIVDVRLHAPFCEPLAPTIIGTTVEALKFGMNELRDRKLRPDKVTAPLQDIAYIATEYLPIFRKYSFDLSKNTLPIRCVASDQDEVINYQTVRRELNRVPHCHVVVISGIGHDIYYLPLHKQLKLISSLGF